MNGRLAVSRAIGDYGLKDVVIGEPDITCLALNGNEDFLIMACDGLWDYVATEDSVATCVYDILQKNNGTYQFRCCLLFMSLKNKNFNRMWKKFELL